MRQGHTQPFVMDLEKGSIHHMATPEGENVRPWSPHTNALEEKILTAYSPAGTYPGYSLEGDIYFLLFPTDSNGNKILDFLNIIPASNTISLRKD